MDEQHIHNEKLVQGQNIAQSQYITQHIHNAGDNGTLSAKLAQVQRFPHQHNFFSDEPISDYKYAIQLDLAAMRAQTGKGDVLKELKRYGEAVSAYDYAISTYKHAIKLDTTSSYTQSPLEKDPLGKSWLASQDGRIDLFKKIYRIILISSVYITSLLFLSLGILWFDFYLFSLFFTKDPNILKLCAYNAISFVLLTVLIIVYVKATKLVFNRIASILKENFGNVLKAEH